MLMGVEGELMVEGLELELAYFGALGARVVSSTIWFVADVLKKAVRAAAGVTVKVATDGCWGVLVAQWWFGSSGAKRVGRGSGEGGCAEGTKRLSRL